MAVKIKVTCVGGAYLKEDCVRIFAADDSTSLLDLHNMIQDAVGFDRDHPFEFYIANSEFPWAKKDWITMEEEWDAEKKTFGNTLLLEVCPRGRKKLYYIFDFGDKWLFEIRKMRVTKADASLEAPKLIESVGPNPEQYPSLAD